MAADPPDLTNQELPSQRTAGGLAQPALPAPLPGRRASARCRSFNRSRSRSGSPASTEKVGRFAKYCVMPGEPKRAGRWRHLGPWSQYCGINPTDLDDYSSPAIDLPQDLVDRILGHKTDFVI